MTLGSSLLLRPKLASESARRFNFYWMLVALVAGVYVFGIAGVVLGPAILGFVKAVATPCLATCAMKPRCSRKRCSSRPKTRMKRREPKQPASRTENH